MPRHRQLYLQTAKSWLDPLIGWTKQALEVVGSEPKVRQEIDASDDYY